MTTAAPMTVGIAEIGNSGIVRVDVSTLKLEPLLFKSETAVNGVMPMPLASTLSYMIDTTSGKLLIVPL